MSTVPLCAVLCAPESPPTYAAHPAPCILLPYRVFRRPVMDQRGGAWHPTPRSSLNMSAMQPNHWTASCPLPVSSVASTVLALQRQRSSIGALPALRVLTPGYEIAPSMDRERHYTIMHLSPSDCAASSSLPSDAAGRHPPRPQPVDFSSLRLLPPQLPSMMLLGPGRKLGGLPRLFSPLRRC